MLLKITAVAAAGPSTHISINNKINNKNHNNMWQMSIKTIRHKKCNIIHNIKYLIIIYFKQNIGKNVHLYKATDKN